MTTCIRSVEEREAPDFVRASWLESYRQSPEGRGLGNADYYQLIGARITALTRAPGARMLLHGTRDDPRWVTGWIAAHVAPGQCTVHYAYVKATFRRQAVASDLLGLLLREAGDGCELRRTVQPLAGWVIKWCDALDARFLRPAAFLAPLLGRKPRDVDVYRRRPHGQ